MSQIQTFSPTKARRFTAPQTRRIANDFPMKASGVSIAALFRTIVFRYRAWQAWRAERDALRSLRTAGDHLLHDIGLDRCGIEDMLRKYER